MDWTKEVDVALTVCDKNAVIIDMNDKACKTFEKYGGKMLIGKSLFDCHSASSVEKIKNLLNSGTTNTYTIEKNGVKKMIHQMPWYENGLIMGLVEMSIVIPFEMPHFVRSSN
jgi:transcriptional regulator with PAS, ATPase and Fis domain